MFYFVTAMNVSKLDIRPVERVELPTIYGMLLEKDGIATYNSMLSCYEYDPEGMLAAVKEDGEIVGEIRLKQYLSRRGTGSSFVEISQEDLKVKSLLLKTKCELNLLTAKLFNLNLHPSEVVSR